MRISICIPIYNVEIYIERCLKSAFEQSYSDIEYILVNDSCSDNSIKIAHNIINKYPNREKSVHIYSHEKNRGLSASRNSAIAHATGKYVLWLDADDYLEKNAIELLVNKLHQDDFDIISFDIMIHNKTKQEIWYQPIYHSSKEMLKAIIGRKAPVCVCGRLIKLELYTKNNIHAIEGINMGEDYQVSTQLAFYAKKVSTINLPLYHYERNNNNSYTKNFQEETAIQGWKSFNIVEKFINEKQIPYNEDFYFAQVKMIANDLLGCASTLKHKTFFKQLRNKLNQINKKYWKLQNKGKLPILYIENYYIVHFYVKTAKIIKRIFK